MRKLLAGLVALAAVMSAEPVFGAPRETAPAAYVFQHPEAREAWREGLPGDCVAVSPTCVYSKAEATVYLLAELSGLGKGYEVEFFLLGHLSDRAYEGLAVAWDAPSVVAKAVEALGVEKGSPAQTLRGLSMAQGERFTMRLRRVGQDNAFRPLADFVKDDCSTSAQDLFGRGFPYVGTTGYDDAMPAAIIAAYTESKSLFGLPYPAAKGAVYGLFRATDNQAAGTPTVIALKWGRLSGKARVLRHRVALTAETLAKPEAFLAELKTLCEDPRDVFLDVRLDSALRLAEVARFAKLLLALEEQGGFTLDIPAKGQLPLRAFAPQEAWRERAKRVFQPWEIELAKGAKGNVEATLCQILEDWTVEGPDPTLTRKCYPGVTPRTLRDTLRKVDVNGGKVYVVFFYCAPEITVGDLVPFAEAIVEPCPTQWIFLEPPLP